MLCSASTYLPLWPQTCFGIHPAGTMCVLGFKSVQSITNCSICQGAFPSLGVWSSLGNGDHVLLFGASFSASLWEQGLTASHSTYLTTVVKGRTVFASRAQQY